MGPWKLPEQTPECGLPGTGSRRFFTNFSLPVRLGFLAALLIPLEDEYREGRKAEIEGVLVAVDAPLVGEFAPQVAQVAAAVAGGIGVEDLRVEAAQGNADAVVGMALGGEVRDHHEPLTGGALAAHEADH